MKISVSRSVHAVIVALACLMIPQLAIAGNQAGTHRVEPLVGDRFSQAEIRNKRVAREFILHLKPEIDMSRMARFNLKNHVTVVGSIPELNMHLIRLGGGADLGWIMRRYQRHPFVGYVEPNYLGRGGNYLPDDTYVADQWYVDNRGQTGGTVDADIDAVEGWEITRGSSAVTVAILDTGMPAYHPEFEGRLLPGYDFVNGDNEPVADHGHGVLVAGLIAANADNAFGNAGVDHLAKLLPVKVLDAGNRGTTFELAQGLVYAAEQGADVINMSLIDYPRLGKVLLDALAYARKAGSILVACAGNGGRGDADRSYPGASPLTLSVGATDHNDARAEFSATGGALDVVAPGLNLPTVSSSPIAGGPSSISGCSAATPLVSGIAALLLSVDMDLSHGLVREILTRSAEDQVGPIERDTVGRDEFYGFGRVNLEAALRLAASLRVVAIDIHPNDERNTIRPYAVQAVPVAILGDRSFDVSAVNCETLQLGPNRAFAEQCKFEDVNGDGFADLTASFSSEQTGIVCGETEVSLSGATVSGLKIVASDAVTPFGCRPNG